MTLYTKCILAPRADSDGHRISVMSRHTLNDGTTPDLRIIPGITYDQWMPQLAPSPRVVGSYYKGKLSWQEFAKEYLAYLHVQDTVPHVKDLAHSALMKDITILCIEETPADPYSLKCHRRLLADECQRLEPRLRVVHR